MLPVTVQFLVAMLVYALNERTARRAEYLRDENRVLKEALPVATGKSRIALTNEQRRKGATRSFPKGNSSVSAHYREVSQPALVPGGMGRASYVLVGTQLRMKETFGSSCHGAGRQLSRKQAKSRTQLKQVLRDMEARGIYVWSHSLGMWQKESRTRTRT